MSEIPDMERYVEVDQLQLNEIEDQSDGTQPDDWVEIIECSDETAISYAIPEPILYFRTMLSTGVPWQRALLQALGRWTLPEETFNGRHYRYLLLGEAFDWLLLAERLCTDVNGLIPPEETEKFLFSGNITGIVSEGHFRDYLGLSKYRAYMNFRYGVTLEEALQLVTEEEVRKRHMSRSYSNMEDFTEESYDRLYGNPRSQLLKTFQKETKKDRRRTLSLSDLKEFTYWLHKRRINLWDPARVASDTRKAIHRLEILEQNHKRRISSK